MAKVHDRIDDRLAGWIARQPMFFVATAPLAADGHVNLSPKGPMGTFGVLDPGRVAYLDVVGSGAETVAHLRENGRIVIMLCAFEGPPRIVRLHGRGDVVLPGDPRFAELLAELAPRETTPPESRRAIVLVAVERVSDSCGYTVPRMDYVDERPHLGLWADKKLRTQGPDALERYKARENERSLDGLPALSG
jgi:hypothetical protein